MHVRFSETNRSKLVNDVFGGIIRARTVVLLQ